MRTDFTSGCSTSALALPTAAAAHALPHLGGRAPGSRPAALPGAERWNNAALQPPALPARPALPPTARPGPHLQLPGGHAGRQLDDTAHRHACRPGRVQLVPNGVTVHLSKQPAPGGRQGRGERERERESMRENKPVREGWQRDSPCTITSVFRAGQLKGLLDMALLMLFLCTGFSNGNTFLSCLAAIPCLDFSLQTMLHRPGRACSPDAPQAGWRGDGDLPGPGPWGMSIGNVHREQPPLPQQRHGQSVPPKLVSGTSVAPFVRTKE